MSAVPIPDALTTPPPSLVRHLGILWRELVAALAMCSRLLLRARSLSPKRKASREGAALRRNHFGQLKPQFGTFNNSVNLQAGLIRKISGTVRNSLNGYVPRYSLVALLLRTSGPTAILGRVVAVIVDAVDRSAGRSRKHVCFKGFVRVPPVANANAAPAIVLPLGVVRVPAPITHRQPDIVQGRPLPKRHPQLYRALDVMATGDLN